jgi:thiosulfate reductase/polysulfide reductase chain A
MYDFDPKIGRRRFIQTAGLGAAAVAGTAGLSGCMSIGSKSRALKTDASEAKAWGRGAGQWIPTCCNMCGGQCGILCHVVNGVVEKIEPNHWNPNNCANISSDFFDGFTESYGFREGAVICPKGNAGIYQLYDPDRVKKPLKRTNPDRSPGADPQWQEISWDQALDEIAGKMRKLKDAGEAHKLLWMSEDHSFTHIQGDFCLLYGSPNYSNHANLCDVARKASFRTVIGHDRPLADFIESKYMLLFGWNPTSAIKWAHLPRIITQGIERGGRLVVVDPYLSDTAAKGQEWVAIRPGTDGAMALAMAHVIIRDKLHDEPFIQEWTVGFDAFSEFVKDKTPEWAEKITSVSAKTITRIARELATTRPALVDVWSGPGQHSNGVQGGRAIAMLNALVGTIDKPGGMMIPNASGNAHGHVEAPVECEATLKQPRFDENKKYPLVHKSGVYTQMFTNLAEGKGPYQPKMMFVVFQNPAMSTPGNLVPKAFSKLETLVVIDTMISETARYADYLLPGTVYLERYDLNTHWVTWPVLGLRQPVVKPIFGQPAEYETVALLGRRLGLKDHEGKEFFKVGPLSGQTIENVTEWYEDYLSNEIKTGKPKISLGEMKKLPGAVWVDKKGTEYQKFAKELPADKLKDAWFDGDKRKDGTPIYDKPPKDGKKGTRIGTVFGGKSLKGFQTPSGKAEFMTASLGEKKDAWGRPVDPLPAYEPRKWQPTADFPLFLINWKEASHTHTRSHNNPVLLELKAENPLIINPETAKKYGIQDGDAVWVESPHGKAMAKAHVSARIHPEVVGAQHGFGHTALGANAKGRGSNFGGLNVCLSDPLSGQALHKEVCVRLTKA